MRLNIPAGREFRLAKVDVRQLNLLQARKLIVNQYNTRYRFFQNFEDNIPPNEILQTIGPKVYSGVEQKCAIFAILFIQVK